MLMTVLPAAATELPDIGNSASSVLSISQEEELGKRIMHDAYSRLNILADGYTTEYINALGNLLVAQLHENHVKFHFFVVNSETINAFALPGGYIGIHTGLIKAAQNESELAAVVAHEISHVSQRHIARMLERQSQLTLPTLAAFVTSIALATQNPNAGTSAIAATVAGAQQYAINFTRDNEKEADRVGIDLLTKAGFNPDGMPDFFQRMQQANRFNSLNYPEFLMTHPVNESRIADAKSRIELLQRPSKSTRNDEDFLLIRGRVEVLTASSTQQILLDVKKQLTDNKTPTLYEQYSYALALTVNNKFAEALTLAKKLMQQAPNKPLFVSLMADIYLQQKQPSKSNQMLAEAIKSYPNNQALVMQYASTLLAAKDPKRAIKVLDDYLKSNPNKMTAYRLLAEAAAQDGKEWQAHEARAHYLVLRGDLQNAIEHLERAQQTAPDSNYIKAKLRAKLAEVKQQAKQEAAN